jgi:hypothetical protein
MNEVPREQSLHTSLQEGRDHCGACWVLRTPCQQHQGNTGRWELGRQAYFFLHSLGDSGRKPSS